MRISPNYPCIEAKKYCIGQKRASKLDTVDWRISRNKRKKKLKDSERKTDCHLQNTNRKMIIDFDCEGSFSINTLAVKKKKR